MASKKRHTGANLAKPHIRLTLAQQPNPFQGVDDSTRNEMARKVGESSAALFAANLAEIEGVIRLVNPLQVLAHFAFYDQLWLSAERDAHGYIPTQQSVVEWLQALTLRISEREVCAVLDSPPSVEILFQANKILNEIHRAYGLMRMGAKEHTPAGLVSEIVRQQTAFVRNEGFPSQIKRLLAGLSKPLDDAFEQREGFKLSHVVDALYALPDLVQTRLNADRRCRHQIFAKRNRHDMIEAFGRAHGLPIERLITTLAPTSGSLDALRGELMTWMDAMNFRHFTFDRDQFAALLPAGMPKVAAKLILDKISIEFGALASCDPERLILENPVWTRPIIHLGNGRYFFPFVSLVQSFGLEMMERFIDPKHSPRHADLWARYSNKVRGDYLEIRTFELLQKALPDAKIYRGMKWKDIDAKIDGESDVLVLLDTQALVFECKSGRLRASASRGEPGALSGDIGKLMSDPAIQAGRFSSYLRKQTGIVRLKDCDDVEHEIDLTRLKHITTVGVVLDYIGSVVTQQRLLRKANLLKPDAVPIATLPLHDLECVLELLERPSMVFHYLRRRVELETTTEVMSDEMGLLALYLATGFDLGELEGDEENRLALPTLADQLEPYFMGKEKGEPVSKPQMRLRPWLRDMLDKFEERKFLGWLDASAALIGLNPENQKTFENACAKLRRNVRSNWHKPHDDTCIATFGPAHNRKALVCLAIKNKDREESRDTISQRMQEAVEKHGAKQVLGLIVAADKQTYPYVGVYYNEEYRLPC